MPKIDIVRVVELIGACLLLTVASSAFAQNPSDLDFHMRLLKEPPTYRPGELIPFELSFTSSSDHKYEGSWTNPRPNLGIVSLYLDSQAGTPPDAFVDLVNSFPRGFGGSILSTLGFASQAPVVLPGELTEWFRFVKPGAYSLRVNTTQISRIKTAAEGGGVEPLTLQSNSVTFNIEPRDSAWEANEISAILRELRDKPHTAQQACSRLAAIDSPSSARELTALYLGSGDGSPEEAAFSRSLSDSRQLSAILPELERALVDPARTPPSSITRFLAELKMRDELGDPPNRASGSDPAHAEELQKILAHRVEVESRNVSRYTAQLLAMLPQRGAPERAAAVYQAWASAESTDNAGNNSSATLDRLRLEVLAVAPELTPNRQLQLLTTAWQKMPRQAVLSLVRLMAPNYPDALKDLCEEAPWDCAALIVAQIQAPNSSIAPYVIRCAPESSRPELDELLKRRLTDDALQSAPHQQAQTAAIILRLGSPNLHDPVLAFLDNSKLKREYGCDTLAYLLGYLFRVSPKDAAERFSHSCAWQVFRTFDTEPFPDRFIDAARRALTSSETRESGYAALFLASHGPSESSELIRTRLALLRRQWRGREGETGGGRITEQTVATRAGELEKLLVSALANAKNWKLAENEIANVRAGCMTEECRDIADRKKLYGL